MTLLQAAFLIDLLVTVPVALTTLAGDRWTHHWFLREEMPHSDNTRNMLGSLWLALAACLLIGLFYPVAMSPVLILQLIYKGTWLMVFAIPRWVQGRWTEVPRRVAVTFLAYVLTFPWVIPWSHLFRS